MDFVVEEGETIDCLLRLRGRECCWICSVKLSPWKLSMGTVWAVEVDDVVLSDEFFELFKELLEREDFCLSTVESGDSEGELKA